MLPFVLPTRAPVGCIRPRATGVAGGAGVPAAPAAGGAQCSDIVDFIVRLTDEIRVDRAVGRIYETYDANCTIYAPEGVVRSVEAVVASALATLDAYPDAAIEHLNVAWSGDAQQGFYTSHLYRSQATNLGTTRYGAATGRRVSSRFCADCISRDDRIHTAWLVHDNGALVRQLGLDVHDAARMVAVEPALDLPAISVPTRLDGQAPRRFYDMPNDTPWGWARHHFGQLWNARRLEHVPFHYAAAAVAHWPGEREATGPRAIGTLIIGLLASLPDATVEVEHVSWSEESDGTILAVRWRLEGTTRPGGLLGAVPGGRPVAVIGMSHMRFGDGHVVEEWTVFDEVGVLAQAYRQ